MSAGWAVGDLALCVDARDSAFYGQCDLINGRSYTVMSVKFRTFAHDLYGTTNTGLALVGHPSPASHGHFAANRFVKITPDQAEPCEAEFQVLLKRSRKVVSA